jgi:hypothetical protein
MDFAIFGNLSGPMTIRATTSINIISEMLNPIKNPSFLYLMYCPLKNYLEQILSEVLHLLHHYTYFIVNIHHFEVKSKWLYKYASVSGIYASING